MINIVHTLTPPRPPPPFYALLLPYPSHLHYHEGIESCAQYCLHIYQFHDISNDFLHVKLICGQNYHFCVFRYVKF